MIGNDVIDLKLAMIESNWKRRGFLDKIFTNKEQLLISNAKNQDQTVWNLWSRKEAAYKIRNRQSGIRAFNPLQLECYDLETQEGTLYGKVICKNKIYYTKTEIVETFIHTVAVVNADDFETVRFLENRENIQKNEGIPNWIDTETLALKPASISHHGQFTRIVSL